MPMINISMNRLKFLLPFLIGTFAYVALSLLFGQNSLNSYKQMEKQKILVSKQTNEIQNINTELNFELKALQNDKAVIAAYARKLDYVSDDEKLVKITGLKPAQTTLYDTGTVLRHTKPFFMEEKYCKMLGLFFFAMSMLIVVLAEINNGNITKNKNDKKFIAGIPVYDLPQI